MMLGMCCVCTTVCEPPMCSSVFPTLSDMLEQDKYQFAIRAVGLRKDWTRYRSLVDFMFVEMFPEWRTVCRKYYYDEGPSLADHPMVNKKLLVTWDWWLAECVAMAYDYATNKVHTSWSKFRDDCIYKIAM